MIIPTYKRRVCIRMFRLSYTTKTDGVKNGSRKLRRGMLHYGSICETYRTTGPVTVHV